jgi:hypothetical protein
MGSNPVWAIMFKYRPEDKWHTGFRFSSRKSASKVAAKLVRQAKKAGLPNPILDIVQLGAE